MQLDIYGERKSTKRKVEYSLLLTFYTHKAIQYMLMIQHTDWPSTWFRPNQLAFNLGRIDDWKGFMNSDESYVRFGISIGIPTKFNLTQPP